MPAIVLRQQRHATTTKVAAAAARPTKKSSSPLPVSKSKTNNRSNRTNNITSSTARKKKAISALAASPALAATFDRDTMWTAIYGGNSGSSSAKSRRGFVDASSSSSASPSHSSCAAPSAAASSSSCNSSVVSNSNNDADAGTCFGHPFGETGHGTPICPLRQPLRAAPNRSGCRHCPSATCLCDGFQQVLADAIAEVGIQRETEGRPGRKDLCAKSLNPNFVARLVREMAVDAHDTFYDFGSGNGSILFQVAAVTGARCIGIELNAHNAELSRLLWAAVRPRLEKLTGRKMPEVKIVTGDVLEYLSASSAEFAVVNPRTGNGPVILCNNVLWPRPTTHYLQERCRECPTGTRICCFDDFFPHGRVVSFTRDPEAFQLFEMRDYKWPLGAVEWAPTLEGNFFIHRKIRNRNELSE